jgi:hypothetical protein
MIKYLETGQCRLDEEYNISQMADSSLWITFLAGVSCAMISSIDLRTNRLAVIVGQKLQRIRKDFGNADVQGDNIQRSFVQVKKFREMARQFHIRCTNQRSKALQSSESSVQDKYV